MEYAKDTEWSAADSTGELAVDGGEVGEGVPIAWEKVAASPDIVFEDTTVDIITLEDFTSDNISFTLNNIEVLFEWKDGKFNVVYDPNKCTESAKTFFDCMLPYLNDAIEEKAKELNLEKERLRYQRIVEVSEKQ